MSSDPISLTGAFNLNVGTSITGEISAAFEKDFYRLHLSAGEQVRISLSGTGTSPLFDPSLELLDPNGRLIEFSSDIDYPDNRNAQIEFIAPETGTYIVDAYASGAMTGAYSLTAATSNYTPTDGIDWGSSMYDRTIEVYFGQAGDYVDYDVYDAEAMTAYEIERFYMAFELIEAVTNLTFVETTAWYLGDFEIYVDTDELTRIDPDLLGYFGPPQEYDAGIGVFNGSAWDRNGYSGSTMELGGYDFTTITHELLHGLGLAHPHDDGGTSSVFPGVALDDYGYTSGDFDLNQGIFTTMSYSSGFYTLFGNFTEGNWGDLNGNWGYEIGPMALDIAVLQEKYGANMTTATGDDVYELPDVNDTGTGWRSIWDAGGTDEIVYRGTKDVQIDLRPATLLQEEGGGGFVSAAYDIAGGFTIANGVVIEVARGGAGDDRIFGNDEGNTLYGGNGVDRIAGGTGDDIIHGGDGADIIYMGEGDDVFQDNNQGTVDGQDTVYGGKGNDIFYGGWGDDSLFGGDGNDEIYGGIAFDYIDAGAGDDTVFGGMGKDEVYLSDGDDTFEDDFQFGWRAEDFVDGGDGNDTIIAYGGQDKLYGGNGMDDIIGGAGADTIFGEDGDDRLRGSYGDDVIEGGYGDDTVTGGYGADSFYFNTGDGHDTLTDLLQSDGDMLYLDEGLASSLDEIVNGGIGSVTADGVVLSFLTGESITITNLDSLDDLDALISIVPVDII